jgi:hypothetical protein
VWLTLLASRPGLGRVSSDGNWFAYLKEVHGSSPNPFEGKLYLYDRQRQTLVCVTCPADATVQTLLTQSASRSYLDARPRFLSDDGKVFFTSAGALLPEDTNGVADVYEYDGQTGALSLLSSGRGSEPANFVDASRSGDDVFIVTRQQLVSSDLDENVDLYDVRVGGGFEEPGAAPVPCSGEACRGAASGSPPVPAIVSGGAGRGNMHQIRCRKHTHKVRRKGKVRCVRNHNRHAKHNRRASR